MLGVARLAFRADRVGERRGVAGKAELGGALEDVEVLRLLGDGGGRLNAGGARAQHRDPLAGQRDPFGRPPTGVVQLALENLDARDIRQVGLGQGAGGADHEAGLERIAPVRPHRPEPAPFVPGQPVHRGVEPDVLAKVVAVGEVQGVLQDLRLGGVALAPVPRLVGLRVPRHRIVHRGHVAAATRVAVPVPGPADVAAALDDQDRHAQLAQLPQHVHAGEPGAHHDGVKSMHLISRPNDSTALQIAAKAGTTLYAARASPPGASA